LSIVDPLSSIVIFFEPTISTAQIFFVPGVLLRTTKFGGGGLAARGERGIQESRLKIMIFVSAIFKLRTRQCEPLLWRSCNNFSWDFSLAESLDESFYGCSCPTT
jgi:hypothetical protein